ncbi:glutathionylspermidine synthase family protein [Acholeplasma hippikon]|nr:glutathionylspermidine synthase family protein [Acholeplasma hippikon]
MKLVKIDKSIYEDYKIDVIFDAYKWDPQVGDVNTVSEYVLLITEEKAASLKRDAENLTKETHMIQEAMLKNLNFSKEVGLSKKMKKYFMKQTKYNRDKNVSLMRYDFHPTTKGFRISEVNSDVPGGLAEATILGHIAKKYLGYGEVKYDIAEILYDSFIKINPELKAVSFVHATSYSDDRQVMQYIGDYFESKGIKSFYNDPTALTFKDETPFLGKERIDGIFRFYPLEWYENLPRKYKWHHYFHTNAISCNHPVNLLSQSKRIPVIWNKLDIDLTTWKSLLPHTVDPKVFFKDESLRKTHILKPNLGRVGEGVMIDGVISKVDKEGIMKAAKKFPLNWVAQEKFESVPLEVDGKLYHLCIGVFTVKDKCAGFYGRISTKPRIDEHAVDIPILVVKGDL